MKHATSRYMQRQTNFRFVLFFPVRAMRALGQLAGLQHNTRLRLSACAIPERLLKVTQRLVDGPSPRASIGGTGRILDPRVTKHSGQSLNPPELSLRA